MKRLISILLLAAFCISLAACQPTPEESFVVNKGDGKLMEIIGGAPAPTLSEPYKADEHWTETIDGKVENKLIVEVDADVIVPNVLEYPVYEAVLSDYDQEYVDNFLHNTIGNVDLYTVNGYAVAGEYEDFEYPYMNMRDAKQIVDAIDYQLNDQNSPLNKYYLPDCLLDSEEHGKKEQNRAINGLLEMLDVYEYVLNHQSEFLTKSDKRYDSVPFAGFLDESTDWVTEDGNQRINIQRKRNEAYTIIYEPRYISNGSAVLYNHITSKKTDLIGMNKDVQSAENEAHDLVQKLGLSDWELVNTGAARTYTMDEYLETYVYLGLNYAEEAGEADQYDFYNENIHGRSPEAYYFTYAPKQSGIPALYFANKQKNDYANRDWYMPYLQIAVDNDGIKYVKMVNGASGFSDCLNKNVPLLSFEEIQQKFRDYIVMNTDFSDNKESSDRIFSDHDVTRIHIDDVRLGYIKVKMINSNEYMTVPAWCFYGQEYNSFTGDDPNNQFMLDENNEHFSGTKAGHSFLCINAIDGSIIDLTKGY